MLNIAAARVAPFISLPRCQPCLFPPVLSLIAAAALMVISPIALAQATQVAATQPAATMPLETSPLRVISFNIRYDNPDDGEHAWPHRRPRVTSLLQFYAPDLIGLQEVLAHQLDQLAEDLPGYSHVGVGRDDGKAAGEFSPIFYRTERFEQIDSGTFWLSLTPDVVASKDWDAGLTRIVTWARLKDRTLGDDAPPLLLFNTHFDNRGKEARTRSAEVILQKLETMSQGATVIVTGDFNTTPDSDAYRTLVSALTDTRTAAGDAVFGPRPTTTGFVAQLRPMDQQWPPIDYIFVEPAVGVVRQGHLSHTWNGRHASDHMAVLADLLIQRDAKAP